MHQCLCCKKENIPEGSIEIYCCKCKEKKAEAKKPREEPVKGLE